MFSRYIKTCLSILLCVALLPLSMISSACVSGTTPSKAIIGEAAASSQKAFIFSAALPEVETYTFATAHLHPYSVEYKTYGKHSGWQSWIDTGELVDTVVEPQAIEAFSATLSGLGLSGSITYRSHNKNSGWQSWESNGSVAGAADSASQPQQIEAIQMQLTDELAAVYEVYYRVHVAGLGWLGWAKGGETAGTTGVSSFIEAMQIKLVSKNAMPPGSIKNSSLEVALTSQACVTGSGWLSPVNGHAYVGAAEQNRKVEAFKISVEGNIEGSIEYQALAQGSGWLDWATDNTAIGFEGLGKRLEAIKIRLTGGLAEFFDVYYRTHCEEWGWMDWAKNGDPAGTGEVDLQLEAFQVVLVPKGAPAPGLTEEAYMESYPLPETQKYMNAIVAGVLSRTDWLIAIDPDNCVFGVYYGSQGNWESVYFWICSPGAPVSPTPKGLFSVGSKGYVFGSGYACYWYTQFYGDYLMHSLLHYPGTFTLMEDTLGRQASQGCVRLEINNAKWVYDNIPYGTAVYIY